MDDAEPDFDVRVACDGSGGVLVLPHELERELQEVQQVDDAPPHDFAASLFDHDSEEQDAKNERADQATVQVEDDDDRIGDDVFDLRPEHPFHQLEEDGWLVLHVAA